MAIFYFKIHIISRGKGGSAISAAAYRACQELYNPYDGHISDYTHKTGNVYSQIFIPDNTPDCLLNREKLWGSLEAAEKNKRAQLCREVTVALPKELELKEQIKLVNAYITENFLSKGIVCDINIHDKGDGNPHAHILLPMRGIDENGQWANKQRKIYTLDEVGNKIYDKEKKQYACRTEPVNDWGNKENLISWRKNWAKEVNHALEQNGIEARIDYRSYKEQGIRDRLPQTHEGKKHHIVEDTFSLNINQQIKECNLLGSIIVEEMALIYKEYTKSEEEQIRRR